MDRRRRRRRARRRRRSSRSSSRASAASTRASPVDQASSAWSSFTACGLLRSGCSARSSAATLRSSALSPSSTPLNRSRRRRRDLGRLVGRRATPSTLAACCADRRRCRRPRSPRRRREAPVVHRDAPAVEPTSSPAPRSGAGCGASSPAWSTRRTSGAGPGGRRHSVVESVTPVITSSASAPHRHGTLDVGVEPVADTSGRCDAIRRTVSSNSGRIRLAGHDVRLAPDRRRRRRRPGRRCPERCRARSARSGRGWTAIHGSPARTAYAPRRAAPSPRSDGIPAPRQPGRRRRSCTGTSPAPRSATSSPSPPTTSTCATRRRPVRRPRAPLPGPRSRRRRRAPRRRARAGGCATSAGVRAALLVTNASVMPRLAGLRQDARARRRPRRGPT